MSEPITPDAMRQMLQQKYTNVTPVEKAPIATLNKGKNGQIDVTDQVIEVLTPPIVKAATDNLKPVIVQTISEGLDVESKKIEDAVAAAKADADKQIKRIETAHKKSVDDLTKLATQVRPIEIRTEQNTYEVNGVQHENFELLLRIVGAKLAAFLVGPAGTGKTQAAKAAADALGLEFYAMSVGSQTSKSDIFGYKDAQGVYHSTPFREAYEKGGVFLLDEADAGNANVLVGLNAALSNGYVFFPDGGMTPMHDDFRMVATANTFGNGASRQYVGRNQLDAATLDRFTVIVWNIDDRIEEQLSTLSPMFGERWLKVVRAVRHEAIDKLELRAVVSPRATLRGATLLEAGVEYEDVVEVALLTNMPEAERDVLRNIANAAWAKSGVKRGRPKKEEIVEVDDLDGLIEKYNSDDDENESVPF